MRIPDKGRRKFLGGIATLTASSFIAPRSTLALSTEAIQNKIIPSSGEAIPVVGLGSSRTFNVGNDPVARNTCAEVMRNFFTAGGTIIDSSPMYGTSQDVIGYGLEQTGLTKSVFSADKVWTSDGDGPEQMEQSRQHWGVDRFDLMQVHNLVDWQDHLELLYRMKQEKKIRYVGITTSHGRRHEEFEYVMENYDLDFVQLSYNIIDREVEQRLLPLAQERGIAVIINRPFQRGDLIDDLQGEKLPIWAAEFNSISWPQFLLSFVVSHPAVTCAIPATSRVDHVKENMQVLKASLPDQAMRQRMIKYVESL